MRQKKQQQHHLSHYVFIEHIHYNLQKCKQILFCHLRTLNIREQGGEQFLDQNWSYKEKFLNLRK